MAKARRSAAVARHRGQGGTKNGKTHARRRPAARPAQAEIGSEDLKHLAKAPGDYHEIARKFADALDLTKFRGAVSAPRLRSMVTRALRLAQRAHVAQVDAVTAERRRIVQDSQAWKSMLANWRLVTAAMPDRPDLQPAFAFMQEYMAVKRSGTPPPPPNAPSA